MHAWPQFDQGGLLVIPLSALAPAPAVPPLRAHALECSVSCSVLTAQSAQLCCHTESVVWVV